jgi:hypothetical protein
MAVRTRRYGRLRLDHPLRSGERSPRAENTSVLGRMLNVVDNEQIDHASCRFEFEPELFLQRRKD